MSTENQAKLAGQIRHVLSLAAGYLIANGKLSEADATAITGVAVAIVPVVWSWIQKRQQKPVSNNT